MNLSLSTYLLYVLSILYFLFCHPTAQITDFNMHLLSSVLAQYLDREFEAS
jgi:hypothetical protein